MICCICIWKMIVCLLLKNHCSTKENTLGLNVSA
jgi:hypothetical protein